MAPRTGTVTTSAARSLLTAALAIGLGLASCAPGLEGDYRLSGDVSRPDYVRFHGALQVDDDGTGFATLEIGDQPSVRLPLCRTKRTEDTIYFEVDAGYPPARTCDGMARRLVFRGEVGGHVVSGVVADAEGTRLGLWRALRRFE